MNPKEVIYNIIVKWPGISQDDIPYCYLRSEIAEMPIGKGLKNVLIDLELDERIITKGFWKRRCYAIARKEPLFAG